MRHYARFALLLSCVTGLIISASSASGGAYTKRGLVTRVVDGDTLDVAFVGGKVEPVRLIGIDAAESGQCYAAKAKAAAQLLAGGETVTVVGDKTQATRDKFGRLLAYVWLPGGKDLGFKLIANGYAKVYVYDKPFLRLPAYRKAEAGAHSKGLWLACGEGGGGGLGIVGPAAAPKPTPTATCQAGYTPCLPVVGDLDCGEIDDSLKPIRVTGDDPYRLDADNDGYGCDAG